MQATYQLGANAVAGPLPPRTHWEARQILGQLIALYCRGCPLLVAIAAPVLAPFAFLALFEQQAARGLAVSISGVPVDPLKVAWGVVSYVLLPAAICLAASALLGR